MDSFRTVTQTAPSRILGSIEASGMALRVGDRPDFGHDIPDDPDQVVTGWLDLAVEAG